jgi:hypothetical protein
MLDTLRKPFFFAALFFIGATVLTEIGSAFFGIGADKTVGLGIPYLALVDSVLAYSLLLMAISLLAPQRIHGRVQGVATLIVSLLVLWAAFSKGFVAFVLLMVMVSLLFAPVFGTIAYFAGFSNFAKTEAAVTLGGLMTLKLCFAACLLLAHQRFLQNKGLVIMVLTSLVASLIVSILHGFVPGFLVSITDAIAAIITAILAFIWGIVLLIGSVIAVIKAIV